MYCSVLDTDFVIALNNVNSLTLLAKETEVTNSSSIKHLIKNHKVASHLNALFPGVFTKESLPTAIPATSKNKLLLKYRNIQYLVNEQKSLVVTSFIYNPVYLAIRLLRYQNKENHINAGSIDKIASWQVPSDKTWLLNELGNNFSHGRLLDFADQMYDEYKQTEINPFIFRNIFFAFLSETSIIGNNAFDNYMSTRNSSQSWELAVVNYLNTNYNLRIEESSKVVQLLFSLD